MNYRPKYQPHLRRLKNLIDSNCISNEEGSELFENLDEHIHKWLKKEREETRWEYYIPNLFPLVKKIFDLQLKYDLLHSETERFHFEATQLSEIPSPKVLVQLVGFSIAPLLLSALAIRPTDRLILLYSKETEKKYKNTYYQLLVENEFNVVIEDDSRLCLVDSTKPSDIYEKIEITVGKFNPKDIAIDITGGKKSLISAAFITASIKDYAIYYVDHEEYLPGETTPLPGTEYLTLLPNYKEFSSLHQKLLEEGISSEDQRAIIKARLQGERWRERL